MFMENRLPPNDPRRNVVFRNFARNLEDILKAGRDSGAKVLLNTVAVNLKDCPPFASLSDTNLPPPDREACEQFHRQARVAQSQGNFAEAARLYDQAAHVDGGFAEFSFQAGVSLLRLTNATEALNHFQTACDLDALPFRAVSRLNQVTRDAAKHRLRQGFDFFDAAEYFATNSPAGAPGNEVFYEHVHFNFDGNYRLARIWAERIEPLLPARLKNHVSNEWATQTACEGRLGLTDWNRISVLQEILQRLNQPPFTGQSDHSNQVEAVRQQIREMRARMDTSAASNALALYVEALQRAPDDHRLHENLAEFLEDTGNLTAATVQWKKVSELLPHHHLGYFQAGRLLTRQANLVEAEPILAQAIKLRPDLAEGWLELGKVHDLQGKLQLALQDYQRERELAPQDHRSYYHSGKALSKLNRRPEAIAQLRQCVRLKPDYWEGRYALGEELAFDGQTTAARAEFEEVLRMRPGYAMAHLNLGVTLVQQGQLDAAENEFRETLRLDPQKTQAREYLEKVSAR